MRRDGTGKGSVGFVGGEGGVGSLGLDVWWI